MKDAHGRIVATGIRERRRAGVCTSPPPAPALSLALQLGCAPRHIHAGLQQGKHDQVAREDIANHQVFAHAEGAQVWRQRRLLPQQLRTRAGVALVAAAVASGG
ncbi:MAG: hypothetical protein U1E73_12355 [Planctomycetota bacterium]